MHDRVSRHPSVLRIGCPGSGSSPALVRPFFSFGLCSSWRDLPLEAGARAATGVLLCSLLGCALREGITRWQPPWANRPASAIPSDSSCAAARHASTNYRFAFTGTGEAKTPRARCCAANAAPPSGQPLSPISSNRRQRRNSTAPPSSTRQIKVDVPRIVCREISRELHGDGNGNTAGAVDDPKRPSLASRPGQCLPGPPGSLPRCPGVSLRHSGTTPVQPAVARFTFGARIQGTIGCRSSTRMLSP